MRVLVSTKAEILGMKCLHFNKKCTYFLYFLHPISLNGMSVSLSLPRFFPPFYSLSHKLTKYWHSECTQYKSRSWISTYRQIFGHIKNCVSFLINCVCMCVCVSDFFLRLNISISSWLSQWCVCGRV